MADTKNSLQLMRRNLLRLGVLDKLTALKPKQLEEPSLRASNPEIFLQLTNYLITEHSSSLFSEVIEIVPNIRSLSDKKFMDACYLVMRDILECFPVITVQQFLTPKFFDLKLQFIADLAKKVYDWDQLKKSKKIPNTKSSELEYQRPTELREVVRRPQAYEQDEQEEEPRVVTVAPTRIPKPIEQPKPQPKAHPVRPTRFDYDQTPSQQKEHQDSRQQIRQLYQLVGNISVTLSDMSSKFNSFQEQVLTWVNNINAKVIMLEDKVRIIQSNM